MELPQSLLIGSGNHRACYQHPTDKNLCIKVHFPNDNLKNTRNEIRYCNALARQKRKFKILSPYISNYRGQVVTDQGEGYIYDLIRDENGEVSKELEFYLQNKKDDAEFIEQFKNCYQKFKKSAFQVGLICRAIAPDNLALQLDIAGNPKTLVLIDNLGSSSILPLNHYFRSMAKPKVTHRFTQFEAMMQRVYHIAL